MKTLKQIRSEGNYHTDKTTDHSYGPTYDKIFALYRDKEFKLVEVGYRDGGSLSLWEDYFPKAQILGIDITNEHRVKTGVLFKTDRVRLIVEDINNMTSADFEGFSIAIDDGSHQIDDQLTFVKIMLPVVKGLIIIEDVNFSRVERFKELGECEIVDLRAVKNQHDDVLVIYKT